MPKNKNILCSITGLSTATISRYFNQPHLLKAKTRLIIQNAISSSGYEVNKNASALAKKKIKKIVFITPGLMDYLSYSRFKSLQLILSSPQALLMPFSISFLEMDDNIDLSLYETVIFFQVSNPNITPIPGQRFLFLFPEDINQATHHSSYIFLKEFDNGLKLADLFVPASHQHPLFLLPDNIPSSNHINTIIEGIEHHFMMHNLEPTPENFLYGADTFETGLIRTQESFEKGLDYHSIIAFSNDAALGAIAAIQMEGLSYPYDVQIVCYSQPYEYLKTDHQLTYMAEPLSKIKDDIFDFIRGENIQKNYKCKMIMGETY